ncbi:cytochrome P450 [Actinokineospora enzanensis]|uniref:cytochrome P450 n=1 Tax=Actinokineospora enzanensis TaxID=155975 RepID=UPI00039FF360|nr:cytochrome P450 [Actinokineospora enzanensis]
MARPPRRTVLTGGVPAWLVTRYDEILDLAGHGGLRCDPRHGAAVLAEVLGPEAVDRPDLRASLLTADASEHARLRAPIIPTLSRRRDVEIAKRADDLVARFASRGQADLVAEFAAPLATITMCEVVGVPEGDHVRVQAWLDASLAPIVDADALAAMNRVLAETADYLAELIPRRRARPEADLLSELVRTEELSDNEITELATAVLFAGSEAPAAVIANGLLALLCFPEQLAELRANPALVPHAVEELIRYRGPVEGLTRYTATDIEIGGVLIPKGEQVILCIGVANRDETRFPGPDRIDLHRGHIPHLGFGRGPHHCPGSHLGRVIARTAVTAVLGLDDLRLTTPPDLLRRRDSVFVHGVAELPVAFSAGPQWAERGAGPARSPSR